MATSRPFAKLKSPIADQVPLAKRTTWRIGGAARWLATPGNRQELAELWTQIPAKIPRFLLGGGSNILVEDSGFDGVAVDLCKQFNKIEPLTSSQDDPEQLLNVEAGVKTSTLAHYARRNGLSGAEFLGGIPGSIGGAMRMNAGAHGYDIATILHSAQLLDNTGKIHDWPAEKLGLAYRTSQLPAGWLFVAGTFKLCRGPSESIRKKMCNFNNYRRQSQPLAFASAGSTFKNPAQGPAAWQLIDAAGLRGTTIGEAQVSEKHSNFLINRGRAKSRDMLALIDRVRERVIQTTGTSLHLEIAILGPKGVW